MSAPRLVIAAGGTGGHMFPAQALAEAMLGKGWAVTLTTDERGARYTGNFPKAVDIEVLASATFARGGALAKAAVPVKLAQGVLGAVARLRALKPRVVVGFGGYPSIPALSAAWLLGIPRMIQEQNGILGKVNRVFARRVAVVACGTWPTDLPAGAKAEHTGNPVRAAIHAEAGAPYQPPGDGPIRVLAMGGSQGARILSDVVPAALAGLPDTLRARLQVAHQARPEDEARVTSAYAEAGITAEVRPFFDDIPARMRDAQLVISRAGASSIADLTVIGRPSILIPFAAAAADHQTANARGLKEAGAALVFAETEATPERIRDAALTLLDDPEKAAEMAKRALTLGRPDATERLVKLVEKLRDLQ